MFKKLTVKSPGDEIMTEDGAVLNRPENYTYDFDTASVEIASKHIKNLISKGYDVTVSVVAKIPKES